MRAEPRSAPQSRGGSDRTSPQPVVACYRGLDCAGAAALGGLLAAGLRAPLVLAGAYRYAPMSLSARVEADPGNERRAEAARHALVEARALVPDGVEVREHLVPASDTAGALIGLARTIDAGLLVVGRDTRGHVTRSLVPRTPCPVAVAPPGVQPAQIGRVGVAFDGSRHAYEALIVAERMARALRARLVILAAATSVDRASASLQMARLLLGSHAGEFEMRALLGEPRPALAQACAGIDLLVCGSRGRSRRLAAILGSVSAHLVMHARCPVVVVPPEAGARLRGPAAGPSTATGA